ncbi:MAG: hypothetical protein ACRDFX_09530, partial [Chloroflexota bacterium]
ARQGRRPAGGLSASARAGCPGLDYSAASSPHETLYSRWPPAEGAISAAPGPLGGPPERTLATSIQFEIDPVISGGAYRTVWGTGSRERSTGEVQRAGGEKDDIMNENSYA